MLKWENHPTNWGFFQPLITWDLWQLLSSSPWTLGVEDTHLISIPTLIAASPRFCRVRQNQHFGSVRVTPSFLLSKFHSILPGRSKVSKTQELKEWYLVLGAVGVLFILVKLQFLLRQSSILLVRLPLWLVPILLVKPYKQMGTMGQKT